MLGLHIALRTASFLWAQDAYCIIVFLCFLTRLTRLKFQVWTLVDCNKCLTRFPRQRCTTAIHHGNSNPRQKASKPFSSFSTFLPTFQIVYSRGILLYPRVAFSQGCTRWSWWSTIGQCRWVKCINGLLSKFWGVGEGSTCNMVRGVCVCVFFLLLFVALPRWDVASAQSHKVKAATGV